MQVALGLHYVKLEWSYQKKIILCLFYIILITETGTLTDDNLFGVCLLEQVLRIGHLAR